VLQAVDCLVRNPGEAHTRGKTSGRRHPKVALLQVDVKTRFHQRNNSPPGRVRDGQPARRLYPASSVVRMSQTKHGSTALETPATQLPAALEHVGDVRTN